MNLKDLLIEIEEREFYNMLMGYYLNSIKEEIILNESINLFEGEIEEYCKIGEKAVLKDTISLEEILKFLNRIVNDPQNRKLKEIKLKNYNKCIEALTKKLLKNLTGVQPNSANNKNNKSHIQKALDIYHSIFNNIKNAIHNTTENIKNSIKKLNLSNSGALLNILEKFKANLIAQFEENLKKAKQELLARA